QVARLDDEALFWGEGQPQPQSQNDMKWTLSYVVEPGYLPAMRIPLLRGRFFTAHDDEHSPLVAVVDDVFAHTYFGRENPIGKHVNIFNAVKKSGTPIEIVGIVG